MHCKKNIRKMLHLKSHKWPRKEPKKAMRTKEPTLATDEFNLYLKMYSDANRLKI